MAVADEWGDAHTELSRLVERIREADAMTEEEIQECVDNAFENTRPAVDDGIERQPKPKKG